MSNEKTQVIHRSVVMTKAAGELAPGEFVAISTVDLEFGVERAAVISMFDSMMGMGGGRYETMVFRCDAEGKVASYTDLDCARTGYLPAVAEQHAAMVAKWSKS